MPGLSHPSALRQRQHTSFPRIQDDLNVRVISPYESIDDFFRKLSFVYINSYRSSLWYGTPRRDRLHDECARKPFPRGAAAPSPLKQKRATIHLINTYHCCRGPNVLHGRFGFHCAQLVRLCVRIIITCSSSSSRVLSIFFFFFCVLFAVVVFKINFFIFYYHST